MESSDKLQLRGLRFRIPAARRLAVDGRDVLDRNLAAACFRPLYFHFGRVAGLLADLLIGGGLVFDEQLRRSLRFEKEDLRFGRNTMIDLVHDCAAKFKSLEVGRLTIRVSARKDPFTIW